jgi:hypothetical protein
LRRLAEGRTATYSGGVSISPPTARAVQVAVALELAWATFLLYVTHHYEHQSWRLVAVNVINGWADAAVAIVVVTWLVDVAVAHYRQRLPR